MATDDGSLQPAVVGTGVPTDQLRNPYTSRFVFVAG
jgi:hypothetical protein